MPDAGQQKDLFSKRWRKVRTWDPSELQIQISVVEHARYFLRKDVVMFHCPNGEERDKRVAAKLQAMGVLPGVADLCFIWSENEQPKILFLELKRRNGRLDDAQMAFALRVQMHGCIFASADSLEGALEILAAHGLLAKTLGNQSLTTLKAGT